MIAREWRCICPADNIEEFIPYLSLTGIKDAKNTPGFKGAEIFKKDAGNSVIRRGRGRRERGCSARHPERRRGQRGRISGCRGRRRDPAGSQQAVREAAERPVRDRVSFSDD